jgi:hypothetical protein
VVAERLPPQGKGIEQEPGSRGEEIKRKVHHEDTKKNGTKKIGMRAKWRAKEKARQRAFVASW